jgi:hypothetical protein
MTQDKADRTQAVDTLTAYLAEKQREEQIIKEFFAKDERTIPQQLRDWYENGLPRMEKRVNAALAKLKEATPDSRPVLISASCRYGMVLNIWALDMGRDLLGLRVREEFTDASGKTASREEDYPAFVDPRYSFLRSVLQTYAFPVLVRDNDQHKEEADWQDYVRKAHDESAAMRREKRGPTTKTIPPMPAIWISRPNGVRVFISVYDAAEYESESVRLEPWFYPGEEPDMQDENTVRLYEDIMRAVILGE